MVPATATIAAQPECARNPNATRIALSEQSPERILRLRHLEPSVPLTYRIQHHEHNCPYEVGSLQRCRFAEENKRASGQQVEVSDVEKQRRLPEYDQRRALRLQLLRQAHQQGQQKQ